MLLISNWVKSNIKYREYSITFSLPRGERMRCGVFFQSSIDIFLMSFSNDILQN